MAVLLALRLNGGMKKPRVLPRPKRVLRRTFIREWRKFRGLTQEQLGERVEMTGSHISMIEAGQRPYTQETLEAIAEALQTDPASLLMRNPMDPDGIWSLWDNAKQGERTMIVNIAKQVVGKTGTDS